MCRTSPKASAHDRGVECALLTLLLSLTLASTASGAAAEAALRSGLSNTCGKTLTGQGFIISSDYLPPVANGQTCSWTLRARNHLFISVSFADFNIGNTASLSAYNGVGHESPNLLTTYLGTGPVGTEVVFNSSVVTLLFRYGYENIPGRAFGLSFASVTPPSKSTPGEAFSECGADISGGGALASPGHPGWYPNDATCQWTLIAAQGATKIELFFNSFDLELDADFVIVYNGSTTNTTDVIRFTGSLVPFTLQVVTTVIVQFTSDPSVGKPGFSARFSSVLPEQPPNLNASCSASCPKTVTPDPSAHCQAYDDPHMRTFDGTYYELQTEGIFYLYRHDNAPIWVQAIFQQCPSYWSTAFCSCAAAVRYWNEVFVVDRCLTIGSQTPPNRVYKSGNFSMMAITNIGGMYRVRLPNGLSVDIHASNAWIGNLDLRTAFGDRDVVQGVCGLYNGNQFDDATFRLGYDAQTVRDSWLSWRVPPNETLFAPKLPPYPERISSCDCSHVKKNNSLPDEVLRVNAQPVPNSELSDSSKVLFRNDENPGQLTFNNRPWPQGWNFDKAAALCNENVRQRPAIALCQRVAGNELNVDPAIENCIRDIHLTGGTQFAATALEAAKISCEDAIRNKTAAEKKSILELMCPNECSNKGHCVKGVCTCQQGMYGTDCSVDLSSPPKLDTTAAVQNCSSAQLVQSVCYQAIVFGSTFYKYIANAPVCHVSARKTTRSPDGVVLEDLPTLRASAMYLSQSDILCPLQIVHGQYNLPFSVTYNITVSNDNSRFSKGVQTMRSFVPPCGGMLNARGVLTSPNYPGRYYASASCTWVLTATAGKSVQLTFNVFSISPKADSFRIVDSGLAVDRFSGVEAAGKVINYGENISVIFTSGRDAVSTGFSVSFTSTPSPTNGPCGGQLTGRGSVQSPGSPGEYPNDAYCLWMLTADQGRTVSLRFNSFDLEETYDKLSVYVFGQQFATFTGTNLPQAFTLPSPAYLLFRSDSSTTSSGFNIDFTSQ